MHITFVLARARNGVIGNAGGIPWRIPEDMKRFKAITMGKPVIMGRKTWESLPKKPLAGRTNIVVTRNFAFAPDGATVVHSRDDALVEARAEKPDEIMVIGGAEIYLDFLPHATRIELTEIDADIEGDTTLPAFDPAKWQEVSREAHTTPDGLPYAYVRLERRGA